MPANQEEKDPIREVVEKQLASTPFVCSSLSRLSGGTANFVYRGTPTSGNPESIIIKHTENYLSSNSSFQLDAARCHFEGAILEALHGLDPYEADKITVKTPHLFRFKREANTQILEDLQNSVDLKNFLISGLSRDVQKSAAQSLGKAIGSWLRAFHNWAASPERADCKRTLQENKLKDLKHYINYSMLPETIPRFPGILEADKATFEEVRDFAAADPQDADHGDEFNIIHGDFWTGNVLIPNIPFTDQSDTKLLVIDWEMAQVGYRALDLGQMIAELYETKLFKDVSAGLWIIEGFVEGYGTISNKMALRTAIHVGVHLVCWGSRVPGWGTPEQVEAVVKVGRDLIVHAWNEDKAWFQTQPLACLFQ